MTRLPVPVAGCTIPGAFSPSQLAAGEHCLLRAVLGSTRDVPSLTAHPAAAIGSAFHELLEMAVRGEIEHAGTPNQDAARRLDQLLDEKQNQLSRIVDTSVPKLSSVFPPLIWRRKRRAVLDLAERYLSGAVPTALSRISRGGRTATELPSVGIWAEIRLEAPELRLRARADLLELRSGLVVIRDLKSGRVLGADGELLPHITRQMRLYGLIARHLWPAADVRLVVDDATEREIPFGSMEEDEVTNWLNDILSRLPADEWLTAGSLATPGQACQGCAYRHVCSSYRTGAPELWRTDSPVLMPLDTWGEIVEITLQSTERCDVRLIDAADREVKVFGLEHSRVKALSKGDHFWLFGLRTRDRRGGPDMWRHPRNFFETTEDDPYANAWALQSFQAGQ